MVSVSSAPPRADWGQTQGPLPARPRKRVRESGSRGTRQHLRLRCRLGSGGRRRVRSSGRRAHGRCPLRDPRFSLALRRRHTDRGHFLTALSPRPSSHAPPPLQMPRSLSGPAGSVGSRAPHGHPEEARSLPWSRAALRPLGRAPRRPPEGGAALSQVPRS